MRSRSLTLRRRPFVPGFVRLAVAIGIIGATIVVQECPAQERLRDALRDFTAGDAWVYDSWDEARSAAERQGKPIFAVFRCVP